MKMRIVILAAAGCLLGAAPSWAWDQVTTTSKAISGNVKSVGRYEVVVVDPSTIPQKIPVNEIVTIYFDDEPNMMETARGHLIEGRYRDASGALDKVKVEDLDRPELEQDLDFYKALCAARLALGGTGTIKEAGSSMAKFAVDNPNSYHYLEACEVVGDLLVAMGLYANAEKYYAQVETAPWPDYKMRANVAIGRTRLAQGKTAEARQAFQSVLDMNATGELAKAQELAAEVGLARCMAVADPEQAIQAVDAILAKADPEDVGLHARAYNTKGTALRKAGRAKEALLAFLHVDVLYFAVPEAHAEALANLADLWNELHKTERAVRARGILEEQYGNSPWAKRGG